jgi:hypothetical protein
MSHLSSWERGQKHFPMEELGSCLRGPRRRAISKTLWQPYCDAPDRPRLFDVAVLIEIMGERPLVVVHNPFD